MRIYPDTIIWNLLCDQSVEPEKLLSSLNEKGATLAVSFHTVYELARTFERDDAKGNTRGQQLFAYLKKFLDLGMPCTKELWELIVAEAYAFENHSPEIDPMATPEQCAEAAETLALWVHAVSTRSFIKNDCTPQARRRVTRASGVTVGNYATTLIVNKFSQNP